MGSPKKGLATKNTQITTESKGKEKPGSDYSYETDYWHQDESQPTSNMYPWPIRPFSLPSYPFHSHGLSVR